jgi:hypothetical protein
MAANGNDIISNMHLEAVYKDAFLAIERRVQEYREHLDARCARRGYTLRSYDDVQTKYALPGAVQKILGTEDDPLTKTKNIKAELENGKWSFLNEPVGDSVARNIFNFTVNKNVTEGEKCRQEILAICERTLQHATPAALPPYSAVKAV